MVWSKIYSLFVLF